MPNAATKAGASMAPTFPIGGILGLIFITLKLCGVIGWSWWWVTAPFWGPFALLFLIILLIMTVGTIVLAVRMANRDDEKDSTKARAALARLAQASTRKIK